MTPTPAVDPPRDCDRCGRLVEYREAQRAKEPTWFNAPVPTFGNLETARMLVVGLAPGVSGANRTGRPFTGDYAGNLLYEALIAHGFAEGRFEARPDDGLTLRDAAVTNAVRCVPPQNKPIGAEINGCRPFLSETIAAMPRLTVILALGTIAHNSVVRTLGEKQSAHKFGHGAVHRLTASGLTVADSYHPSRYNVNTGVLTAKMFNEVVGAVRRELTALSAAPLPA
ncbi:MAG: uracil-DNA glycosylase [Pseudomonadota bacterium]